MVPVYMSTIWAYHHPLSLYELARYPPHTLERMAFELEQCLDEDYTGRNSPHAMEITLNRVNRLLHGGGGARFRPSTDSEDESDQNSDLWSSGGGSIGGSGRAGRARESGRGRGGGRGAGRHGIPRLAPGSSDDDSVGGQAGSDGSLSY